MAYFRCSSGSGGSNATITVTYDSSYYDKTITCTNGTTTFTKTTDSSGSVLFDRIEEEGVWTITCDGLSVNVSVVLEYSTPLKPKGDIITPTDDVQTLLYCAGIFDKSYTTISELLADSTSLLTVISDNNAVNYLVRSTTFAGSVCGNSTAMTYIGANDYCANTLLGDSTWCSAICNSTYFGYVLIDRVPTMTSNTTPSGSVTASAAVGSSMTGDSYVPQSDYYVAFDNNYSSIVGHRGENTSDWWVSYEFNEPISVYKFLMNAYTFQSRGTFAVYAQYLDDNNTWQTMGSGFTVISDGNYTFNLTTPVTAKRFRVYSPTYKTSGYALYAREIQFYGRKAS